VKKAKPSTPTNPQSKITELSAEDNELEKISSITQSNFSKNNNNQTQGERLHKDPPKRNSQAVRQSAFKT
jgi:hypothetical protein